MDIDAAEVLMLLREAAMPAPRDFPEAVEPPVCTLFEHCNGCPYPSHGFVCWVRGGDCMRQYIRKIHGIKEETT